MDDQYNVTNLAMYAIAKISMMLDLMLFPGQPNLLELRTTGAAGECWGDKFGLYKLFPEVTGDDGSPVYRQMHDGDNAENFLYRWDPCCIQCTGNNQNDLFIALPCYAPHYQNGRVLAGEQGGGNEGWRYENQSGFQSRPDAATGQGVGVLG